MWNKVWHGNVTVFYQNALRVIRELFKVRSVQRWTMTYNHVMANITPTHSSNLRFSDGISSTLLFVIASIRRRGFKSCML